MSVDIQNDTPLNALPKSEEELLECLANPIWRITSGCLYKIMIKGDDGQEGATMPFIPNRAQKRFLKRMWNRNLILKARQLGFTTLIAILWLDHIMFNADQRAGIICYSRSISEELFNDKVRFAYDNLPDIIKEMCPAKLTKSKITFLHNNSSMRVAVSVRGNTINRLHVSEFGKICALYPNRAREVVTGSFPAVPINGITVIESTAEGREGAFYSMSQISQKNYDARKVLNRKEFRFHFSPWWHEPKYTMQDNNIFISGDNLEYFNGLVAQYNIVLTEGQMKWYVTTLESEFQGERHTMQQEYPSTPEEAFSVSTEGKYYTFQLAKARKDKRICKINIDPTVPVNTFWDIGLSDNMAIWLHQHVGVQDRFVGYIEGSGEPLIYYTRKLQEWRQQNDGVLWGRHFLPHDGAKRNPGTTTIKTYEDMLAELHFKNIVIVPRIDDVTRGIQMTRAAFSNCWFDEEGCETGLMHLAYYGKTWNKSMGVWSDMPKHDIHSNGADAFRQYAQGWKEEAAPIVINRTRDSWRTA